MGINKGNPTEEGVFLLYHDVSGQVAHARYSHFFFMFMKYICIHLS